MKRMAISNVLIVGLKGLGAEVGEYDEQSWEQVGSEVEEEMRCINQPYKRLQLAGVEAVVKKVMEMDMEQAEGRRDRSEVEVERQRAGSAARWSLLSIDFLS